MRDTDLQTVSDVAEVVHPSHPEDATVFVERLHLYPEGCHVFERNRILVGYIISHPWIGEPPALNTMLGELPAAPTTYYIHDLALLPAARRGGAANAIVTALLDHARQENFTTATLVAVNNSGRFWRKHGFQTMHDQDMVAKIESYGADARVMRATLSRT